MYGRYGIDQFTQFLIWLAIILTLISTFTRWNALIYLSYLPLIYAVFRMLSKNINSRSRENYKYLGVVNAIKNFFRKNKLKISGTKTHRYYNCPSCKQTIRVPKGKGKICITCPKCKTEFIKRT
jgi:ABC-type transport system involved in cytochrome bd biosynthesis fused ATPase/permease subunit